MDSVYDFKAIEKRLREISGENWYPVNDKVGHKIVDCSLCGKYHDSVTKESFGVCDGQCNYGD